MTVFIVACKEDIDPVIIFEFEALFTRNYSKEKLPEWTISKFKVVNSNAYRMSDS